VKKVFILIKEVGEYSDYSMQNLGVFEDKFEAEVEMKRFQDIFNEFYKKKEKVYEDRDLINEYENLYPEFGMVFWGTEAPEFSVHEIDFHIKKLGF